jgi:hypothetical protein
MYWPPTVQSNGMEEHSAYVQLQEVWALKTVGCEGLHEKLIRGPAWQ